MADQEQLKKAKKRMSGGNVVQEMINSQIGKLPPQAVEVEEAVLGAMMLEKDPLTAVIDVLSPEAFYKEAHKHIFASIQNLFQRSESIDILTVTQELRKLGLLDIVGGPYYITQLTNRVASAANIEYHARIVLQKHIQRELIRISTEITNEAFLETTDVLELLDKAEKNLFSITEGNIRRSVVEMHSIVGEAIKQIEAARKNEGGVTGVESGFTELDRITSGWQPSDLVIIAARPAMGKTAFVMSLARNAAIDFKHPVAIFSLEMSSVQLTNRLIASETELAVEKLRKGNLADHEWLQLTTKISRLSEAPIFIDDTPSLSIFELRAKCRRLKAQKNIQMIIVDYLQLMTTQGEVKGGNREQEISNISRSLKSIAKELNVPVIALSQLSRAVESRGGEKKPQLSDLRESGAIEQDADMVIFLYRPEYYNITQDTDGMSLSGIAEVIIAKHRNGSVGTVKLRFIDKLVKFKELDGSEYVEDFNVSSSLEGANSHNNIIRSSRMNDMEDDSNWNAAF